MSATTDEIRKRSTPRTLDELLQKIHPSQIQYERENAVARALDTFHPKPALIQDWDEFRRFMARFYCHAENRILDVRSPILLDEEWHWGMCSEILRREYGQNGFRVAFEMARTGCEGGLCGVLRALCRQIAKEYAERNTATLVRFFLDQFSLDQMDAIIDQYIAGYGRFLPPNILEGNACLLRAHFDKVLEQHPNLMRQMRRIR